MDEVEEENRCCILECDSAGELDGKIMSVAGVRMVVVRAPAVALRARRLGNAACVSLFKHAVDCFSAPQPTDRVFVVGDTAFNYVAGICSWAFDLVVFDGVQSLRLPNSPRISARTVWMTRSRGAFAMKHRGWVRECYESAICAGAIVGRRSRSGAPPTRRHLYYDIKGDESALVERAMRAGDVELATASFPGYREADTPSMEGVSDPDCPVCYDPPSPRVTTMCCARRFCLACASRCMSGGKCPWCRRPSGLWNCSIERGYRPAPFKDVLVSDVVSSCVSSSEDAAVLMVTVDDAYKMRGAINPLSATHWPVNIGRTSASVTAAVDALETRGSRVAVVDPKMISPDGMTFHAITHVVCCEEESAGMIGGWVSACPNAVAVHRMVSIADAAPLL